MVQPRLGRRQHEHMPARIGRAWRAGLRQKLSLKLVEVVTREVDDGGWVDGAGQGERAQAGGRGAQARLSPQVEAVRADQLGRRLASTT